LKKEGVVKKKRVSPNELENSGSFMAFQDQLHVTPERKRKGG
jgi:hypothetical protein